MIHSDHAVRNKGAWHHFGTMPNLHAPDVWHMPVLELCLISDVFACSSTITVSP
jgi:hypothetical protein